MVAVLLDLDGTLTDSRPGIVASLHAALRAMGHQPDLARDLNFAIGPPIADVMGELLRPYRDRRMAEAVVAYRADYGERGLFDNAVYDGIPAALDAMRAGGARLFVATSKRVDFARRILARFGLAERLDGIYGAEPGGGLDHKPELIAHLLATERLDAGQAIMVGDRRYDIEGAHANAVRAFGVLWGYGSREELTQAGADELVAEPGDLAGTVLRKRDCSD